MKRKYVKNLSVILIVTLLFNLLNINVVFGAVDDGAYMHWEAWGSPRFNTPNSFYNGNGTSNDNADIIQRIKGSYSYRARLPQIQSAKWAQPYFWSFDTSGGFYDFTDISFDNIHTPDKTVGYTIWYDSPYGTFLDYEARYVINPNATVIDWKSPTNQTLTKPVDVVQDSIDYAKVLYPSGSKGAYLATADQNGGLADAKTASVVVAGWPDTMSYPVYINKNRVVDSKVKTAMDQMGVKTIYILGGIGRFEPLAGITGERNIIRAGGINRNETSGIMGRLPNEMHEATQNYTPDTNGYIISGIESNSLSNANKDYIKSCLDDELTKKDGSGIVKAATYLMGKGDIGQLPHNYSQPSYIIGIEKDGYSSRWICYWSNSSGAYVYQYVLNGFQELDTKVSVEYRDIDTDKLIASTLTESVKVTSAAGVPKTYTAKTINKYTYNSTKIISGGNVSSGGNPATIIVKKDGENKVIFYYKKDATAPGGDGEITFNPFETEWTNEGKISEGNGSYPVQVEYVGDNPMILEGTVSVHHEEPQEPLPPATPGGQPTPQDPIVFDYDVQFEVKFELKSIEVSGAASSTIQGTSGTVNITQEGENLQLKAIGTWGEAQYELPEVKEFETITNTVIPPTPEQPTGDSGFYNLDWTRTEISTTQPSYSWVNYPVPFTVNVNVNDRLSGIGMDERITVKDSSHYRNNAQKSLDALSNSYSTNIMLYDGIYDIEVKADDIAGNEHTERYQTYYIDGNSPEINFNISNKIFSEDNGAIRKPSILGSGDSFYGTISASDNLSGVMSIAYVWTYGSSRPSSGYTTVYSGYTTYYDRYAETISREVEKPVGDNLYLHVRVYDVAGNYTYRSFGPFEDPIKITNFQVTDIRDPRWTSVFWNDEDYKDYNGKTFKVNEMAIDEDSHPTLKNALPKKGYAFYFDLTTEYLYREEDRIEVNVSYYYIDGGTRTRVDCYYNDNNNPLVLVGSNNDLSKIFMATSRYGNVLIGNYNKLILTKGIRNVSGREWIGGWKDQIQYVDGKTQWWYGKYFIPSSSFFVPIGLKPTPENKLTGGDVLINFEIIGYKNGIETLSTDRIFNYNTGQWTIEGGGTKADYKVGDVILYNGKYGVNSDTKVNVIH